MSKSKTAKVWFPWKNRYGSVKINRSSKKKLLKAIKIGRIYYCTFLSVEKELLEIAYDFYCLGERLY